MKKKINNLIIFLSYFLFIFAWALFIFTAISKPMPISAFNKFVWQDKIVHFFLFGILMLFIVYAFCQKKKDNFYWEYYN